MRREKQQNCRKARHGGHNYKITTFIITGSLGYNHAFQTLCMSNIVYIYSTYQSTSRFRKSTNRENLSLKGPKVHKGMLGSWF